MKSLRCGIEALVVRGQSQLRYRHARRDMEHDGDADRNSE